MPEEIKEVPDVLQDKGVNLDDWKTLAGAGYTADELKDLSKDELEGILDSAKGGDDEAADKSDLTAEQLAAIAAGEETQEQKDLKAKTEKDAAGAKALEDEATAKGITVDQLKTEKSAATAAPAEGTITDDDLLDFEPVINEAELPAVDVVSDEIKAKFKELDEKFDAGGVERAAYNEQRDTLNRQVVMDNIKARDAAKADLVWRKEQVYFFTARPEYRGDKGADGKFVGNLKSKTLMGALREAVASISNDPKTANLGGMETLIAADKAVKELLGIKAPAPAAPAAKAPDKPAAKLPGDKTLGDIPAAAANETSGAFAELDKLSGEAYEDALAKMPERMRNAYLDDSRPGRRG
jgi:hypothetical protein